eukprot:m.911906 g.911906  ORF g.911906 m.911906 type:complete len:100 (+) comp23725_c0_seq36:2253-2552(+)
MASECTERDDTAPSAGTGYPHANGNNFCTKRPGAYVIDLTLKHTPVHREIPSAGVVDTVGSPVAHATNVVATGCDGHPIDQGHTQFHRLLPLLAKLTQA